MNVKQRKNSLESPGIKKQVFEAAGITTDRIIIMLSTARRGMANEVARKMRLGCLACTLKKLSRQQDMTNYARDTKTRCYTQLGMNPAPYTPSTVSSCQD